MSIHFAKCCNPIPGDDSVALLIEGKGLVVHSRICDELKKVKIHKSKIMDVSWDNLIYKKKEFVAKICVVIKNKNWCIRCFIFDNC